LQRHFGGLLLGLASQNTDEQETPADPFDKMPVAEGDPAIHLQRERTIIHLHLQISRLPRRQREAFMLRCWEGFSTLETAQSMAAVKVVITQEPSALYAQTLGNPFKEAAMKTEFEQDIQTRLRHSEQTLDTENLTQLADIRQQTLDLHLTSKTSPPHRWRHFSWPTAGMALASLLVIVLATLLSFYTAIVH